MILIIGGMHRSGSTFTFNIAREILAREGAISVATSDFLEFSLISDFKIKNLIIKAHYPDQLMTGLINKKAILCICSVRDPADAIASWMRIFNCDFESSLLVIENWLKWYKQVSESSLRVNYRTIDLFPLYAILKIQKYILGKRNYFHALTLWHKYRKKSIKKFCDNLVESGNTRKTVFGYCDRETLFHRQHISSIKSRPATYDLSAEQIQHIYRRLREYLL